ncbi:MAG: protein-export chaperone SecB [Proteobacteria bacterium]|nr:protein-export chaperone SecB [Pseudomonadota bacterium]
MADNGSAEGTAQAQAPQVQMKIMGQFIRDMSFENIMVQKGVTGEVQPDMNIQVNLDARKRPNDGRFEVSIKLNVDSKAKGTGDQLFLLEVDYAGIFFLQGIPEDQLHPFLLIECPRMLFPFLRRIVSDVTRDGGYPPLNIDNIDFVSMYRTELARRQQATAAPKHDA